MVSNLALFCLATYLATFKKIGRFFPNHLVTLALNNPLFLDIHGKGINVVILFRLQLLNSPRHRRSAAPGRRGQR